MHIFYCCILASLIQIGFSLNEEETDLNLLSSNYDGVDTLGENVENIESDESGIVVFDTISASLLKKICKNSNTLVYITQEDITIDCEAFNKGDQPVEQALDIVKRSADLEEGSGMNNIEEDTTIKPEDDAAKIPEETTTNQNEAETPEDDATIPEETTMQNEVTTPEDDAATIPEEITTMQNEATTIEDTTEEIPPIPRRKFALTINQKEDTKNDTETDALTTVQSEEIVTTTIAQPTTPKEEDEQKPQVNLKEDKKEEVVITTLPAIPEEENKELEINVEDNKEKIEEVNKPKQVDNHEPNKDAEVVNSKTVTNLHTNEENKQANSDGPDSEDSARTKESTENTKKAGSKDTTILIVLFAAVVVVGALAFGYNYVKKRKQQSADLDRVERGSSIKRSLQNLTKPEGGEPERKPLIGDAKEVEMINMSKAPLENSEKPTIEQVART